MPTILRAAATVALSAGLMACSAATGASPVASVAPASTPAPTATARGHPEPTSSPSPTPTKPSRRANQPSPASPPAAPSIDQATLDAILTSSITLLNMADDELAVIVLYHETAGDTPYPLGSYSLAFTDQQTYDVPAGVYDLEFRQPAASKTGPICTIELGDAEPTRSSPSTVRSPSVGPARHPPRPTSCSWPPPRSASTRGAMACSR
jgi:hypothetical protein